MTLMKYRKTKWMLFTGALLTLGMFAVADAASSQPPDGSGGRRGRMGRPGGPGGSGGTMLPLRSLDLTESQRQLVRGVMEQNAEATRAAGERVREVREALRTSKPPKHRMRVPFEPSQPNWLMPKVMPRCSVLSFGPRSGES